MYVVTYLFLVGGNQKIFLSAYILFDIEHTRQNWFGFRNKFLWEVINVLALAILLNWFLVFFDNMLQKILNQILFCSVWSVPKFYSFSFSLLLYRHANDICTASYVPFSFLRFFTAPSTSSIVLLSFIGKSHHSRYYRACRWPRF